ncbi:hypothetical protein J7T55_003788 [Diaporthe amygdali]|uniref:uncharacterized protein n=1 Tax=Phomopsis amygdali TaxID=1214568 RepID=UPI0022FDD952|nr:uncharacterized protein J7T55_003788 [Diaporthe amygdali]KAJ0117374.1 hypothetical protein J7T55_003788 [Diaporthe amygdali]
MSTTVGVTVNSNAKLSEDSLISTYVEHWPPADGDLEVFNIIKARRDCDPGQFETFIPKTPQAFRMQFVSKIVLALTVISNAMLAVALPNPAAQVLPVGDGTPDSSNGNGGHN